MIVEIRKKSQITIPKNIVDTLNLHEGDHFELTVEKGVIKMEPVAIYTKNYVRKLENVVMKMHENPDNYNTGPFESVEDAIQYLEQDDEDSEIKKWYTQYCFQRI